MHTGIASLIIETLILVVSKVNARELCTSFTNSGTCCSYQQSHMYSICWASNGYFLCDSDKKCSRRFPGLQPAQPLGMVSGFIGNNQLVVPSEDVKAQEARKLWQNGWFPTTAYVSTFAGYFTSIGEGNTLPKSVLQSVPVFFQIDFLRMKAVRYLVVGVVKYTMHSTRTFALGYRNANGVSVVYGDTTSTTSAQILTCMNINSRRDCRFNLNGIRARSLRIVSINYKTNDRIFIEVGGLDYLEADNQWTLDSITRTITDLYFDDERGDFPLKSMQGIQANYSGPDASLVTKSEDHFFIKDIRIGKDHCYINPTKCQDGLSIGFWFKAAAGEQFSILGTGVTSPDETYTGFKVHFEDSAKMNVSLMLPTIRHSLTYSITTYGWHHYLITWSSISGLVLYEDGVSVSQGNKEVQSHVENTLPKIFVGYDTRNNATQLHDLRFWQIRLSEFDAKNLFSPGKAYTAQTADDIKKFRPKDCLDAFTAYGNKSLQFDLHGTKGSLNIRCIPVLNGAKFYFQPITPSVNVSGPWVDGTYNQNFEYDYEMDTLSYFIKRASSCRQTVSYSCMLTKLSGIVKTHDKSNSSWAVGCEGGSCSCDNDTGNIMRRDKQHFNDLLKLPLGRITISGVSTINSSVTYTVGPVECFQDNRFYKSCKDALDSNSKRSGSYRIITPKQAILVYCEFENSKYKSVLHHADSGKTFRVQGFEAHGSYRRQILYNADFETIIKIVDASDSCEQRIEASCRHAMISKYSWFTDRNNVRIPYWAGGQGTGCMCKIDNSCASSKPCNCDMNDNTVRHDHGNYTDKSLFPLSWVRVGETGGSTEYLDLKIGDLVCYSNSDVGSISSPNCTQKLADGTCLSNPFDDGCTNEMNENGCCVFPFTYRGASYQNCSTVDSRIPWCSLTATFSGKWRYCIPNHAKGTIDFTSNAESDSFGGWKIGSDCNGEENSGPCYDMSASSTPSEKVSLVPLEYLARKNEHSSYWQNTFACNNGYFEASVEGSLIAMKFDFTDMHRPATLNKAYYSFKIGITGIVAMVNIYTVIDPVGKSDFISKCRYAHFRNGLYFGPIVWKIEILTSAQKTVVTPDLKEIILPILRSSDPTINQNLYLVFEWKEFIVGSAVLRGVQQYTTHMRLEYNEKRPGNYLYADSLDAKGPGAALVYHTRHFPPTKRCLRFWYHMQDVGDSMLNVNIYQKGHIAKEVLKIVGHQGNNWKKASVPINTYLNANSYLFKISFVAIRGSTVSRSIAIDDISLLDDECTLQPLQAHSFAGDLPKAKLLTSLGHTLSDASNSAKSVNKVFNPDEMIEDSFGYPLFFGVLGPDSNRITATYSEEFKISADFSLCYHINCFISKTIKVFEITDYLRVNYHTSGYLRIIFGSSSKFQFSKIQVAENTWSFVCLVYVHHLGIVKAFFNGKLVEEVHVGYFSQETPKDRIYIGPSEIDLKLYLSCVQFYEEALDDDLVPALKLCPDRHLSGACKVKCVEGSICNPMSGKCVCPSYAKRFVTSSCANALVSSAYKGSIDYLSFDNRTESPWKLYRSISEAKNLFRNAFYMTRHSKFLLVPGPVNSALCFNASAETVRQIAAVSCFSTGSCDTGSTLSVWILVPPILDWAATGNVTLMKYGKLEISYGVVNDMRNGTTKHIPSLMFSMAQNGNRCIWVSMVYGSMITNSWALIAVVIDADNSLKVYYNGKENYVKKQSCQPHTSQEAFAFSSGELPFSCVDELVVWNRPLLPDDVVSIYNSTVFGGKQATRSKIKFRRLIAKEPEDLWAIDQSNTLYKYYNASWVPLPEKRVREATHGAVGVFVVSWDNLLWRRTGISPEKPIGEAWQKVDTDLMFKGAITDLETVTNGLLHAKSAYQWHCLKTTTTASLKTVNEIKNAAYSQLSCTKANCWSLKSSSDHYIASLVTPNTDCSIAFASKWYSEPTLKRIGTSFNTKRPFAVRQNDSRVIQRIAVVGSGPLTEQWLEANSKTVFNEVIGFNGQAVGITSEGDIEIIKRSSEAFLIKPSSADTYCLKLEIDKFQFDVTCKELFAYREDFCLLHLDTNMIVTLESDKLGLGYVCTDKDKMRLKKDGTITQFFNFTDCIIGCKTSACVPMLSASPPQQTCIIFSFVAVSPIKHIPSHNLIWNETNDANADVKVDIKVTFHLQHPRWTDEMAHPRAKMFQFFCKKVYNEMQQLFAGNVNYKNLECENFENANCSQSVAERCHFTMHARLSFVHIDEDTRALLFSSKMTSSITDCNGIMCTIEILPNAIGVDLNPHKVVAINTTSSTVTVQTQSPGSRNAAEAGYTMSAIGKSAYEANLRTIYMETISMEGSAILLKYIPAYFNYSCTVIPLFVQGSGQAEACNFQTKEDVPSKAPSIRVNASQRQSLEVILTEIDTLSWNAAPLGYRIYYQSLLKLEEADNLTIDYVERNYNHVDFIVNVNFTEQGNQNFPMVLEDLDAFTNYSIIAAAYSHAGVGSLRQIFWRTDQGEPEVPPSNFEIKAINSTHLNASWSMTDDIELLNGWFISNYSIVYMEYSLPSFTMNGSMIVAPNMMSVVIGPLNPWREYRVFVAGNVESRPGVFTSLCVRTDEDVPAEPPDVSRFGAITSSSINYSTGCLKLPNEHGIILFYNISATPISSSHSTFYIANVTVENCIVDSSCFDNTVRACPSPDISSFSPDVYLTSQNCSKNRTIMSKASSVVYHVLDQLKYWTTYYIRAAACTRKGCGPFSDPYNITTDQHRPTCPPNAASLQNTSSTSLLANWSELPVSCAHGVILYYNLFVSPADELSGDECFNHSSCWANKTSENTKFYVMANDSWFEISGLKKYKSYCTFVQAVNIKGRSPVSKGACAYTAEDEPDGPPAIVDAHAVSSRSIQIMLEKPTPDVVNGIILGYHVFYSLVDKGGNVIGQKSMVDVKRSDEKTTVSLLEKLEEYTWYSLTARAYTSIGSGPNTTETKLIRTFEDVPTRPPRDLSTTNIQSNSFVVNLNQTGPWDLNGIFTEFKVKLTENCRNGTVFEYSFFAAAWNESVEEATKDKHGSNNETQDSPPKLRRRRSASQSQSSASEGNTTLNGTQYLGNGTMNSAMQGNSSKSNLQATAHMNLTDLKLGLTNKVTFNAGFDSFGIQISGLLPYTVYNISISTCTRLGCGPAAHWKERTSQSVPSGAPKPHLHADKTLDSLSVRWYELPIMQTSGIITGYMIKWMKNCEYLRLMKLPEDYDCRRVLPENTMNFTKREVGISPMSTVVTDLDPYTWYRFEFCAKTVIGYGLCSNIMYQTDETTPCMAPNVTAAIPVTGKSFRIKWDDVPMPCQRGIILGYFLYYQLTSLLEGNDPQSISFESANTTENSIFIDNLALKSNFSVKIAAYTSKGIGVNSSIFYAMTGDYKHGNWSEWSVWTYCSKSCGGGINVRHRKCDNPAPFNGGDDCKENWNETKSCSLERCSGPLMANLSQNCVTACSSVGMICSPSFKLTDPMKIYAKEGWPCDNSEESPIYDKPYHPSYDRSVKKCEGYSQMPALINCTQLPPNDGKTTRLCNCVSIADCGCEEWAEWSLCSTAKCGGGTKTRKRTCASEFCTSSMTTQRTECNMDPCPINGNWGAWTEATPCNKSCGYGYKHRYRKCDDPAPTYGGEYCRGPSVDVIPECNVQQCPVHGNWGNWGEWRVCNRACGGGLSIRRRYCDSPSPRYNGRDCEGEATTGVPCNLQECDGIRIRFLVKLVDFKWEYFLVYNHHPQALKIADETRSNVKACYNYSSTVHAVDVLNLLKGSVVVNFTIYYVKVADSEVLLLQDYITSTGRMYNLSTVFQEAKPMEIVAEPPHSLRAQSFTHNTMMIYWKPPENVKSVQNVSGYYIFYREVDGPVGRWNAAGVPNLTANSFLLRDLKAYTTYKIRMTLAVKTGNGPGSEEVVNKTIEGVPSAAPTNLGITAVKSSEVYVQWSGIEYSKFNGRELGYVIRYKTYFAHQFMEKKVPKEILETSITDLKPFTLYVIEVMAYSGGGYGLPVSSTIKTPEGAPSVSPGSFKVRQGYSTAQLQVSWSAISDDAANGILLGYKLKYTITHVSGQPVVGAKTAKEFVLDKFTFFYEFTDLQSYTTYSVSICGYTGGGEGPDTIPIAASTCKCPQNIFANWYPNPPYTSKGVGLTMSGFMPDLVFKMISLSCGKCSNQASKVHHFQSLSGENPMKKSQESVKKVIGNEYHISYPIFGSSSIRNYMDSHIFILIVQSAGSATVVKNEIDHSKTTINVFKSILNIWPMYLIVVCLTSLAGILVWFMERNENEEFSRGNYVFGIFQGFWWAFISMTTVGYGDITPRTVKGRVVAIMWTLAGLVLTGILTGSLTSSVTSMTIPPDATLYGTECAAINRSFEHNLAVRRNSKVNTKKSYETTEEVLNAVKGSEVEIALLDGFTVAGMWEVVTAKGLKISGIISSNNGYGVVLSNEFVRMEQDFRSFISSKQEMISSFKANMTEKLQNAQSDAESEIPLLFDPSTKIFWEMIYGECIMITIFSVLGISYSIYRSRKGKNKVMSEAGAFIMQLETLGEMVTEFEDGMMDKLEMMSRKHFYETSELLRIQLSYQRLLKRNQALGRHDEDSTQKIDVIRMDKFTMGDSSA